MVRSIHDFQECAGTCFIVDHNVNLWSKYISHKSDNENALEYEDPFPQKTLSSQNNKLRCLLPSYCTCLWNSKCQTNWLKCKVDDANLYITMTLNVGGTSFCTRSLTYPCQYYLMYIFQTSKFYKDLKNSQIHPEVQYEDKWFEKMFNLKVHVAVVQLNHVVLATAPAIGPEGTETRWAR